MMGRFLMAMLFVSHPLLVVATSGASAGPATCAALLPMDVRSRLESTYRDWQVLEGGHLDLRQQAVWGSRCPGVAVGDFKGTGEITHAVVVVRQLGPTKQAKLLLAEKRGSGFAIQVLRE
jgi:hypothetical protein